MKSDQFYCCLHLRLTDSHKNVQYCHNSLPGQGLGVYDRPGECLCAGHVLTVRERLLSARTHRVHTLKTDNINYAHKGHQFIRKCL